MEIVKCNSRLLMVDNTIIIRRIPAQLLWALAENHWFQNKIRVGYISISMQSYRLVEIFNDISVRMALFNLSCVTALVRMWTKIKWSCCQDNQKLWERRKCSTQGLSEHCLECFPMVPAFSIRISQQKLPQYKFCRAWVHDFRCFPTAKMVRHRAPEESRRKLFTEFRRLPVGIWHRSTQVLCGIYGSFTCSLFGVIAVCTGLLDDYDLSWRSL